MLVPFIADGPNRLGSRKSLFLSGFLVAAVSAIGFTDGSGIGNGYSAFWLVLLWLVGKSMRQNRELISRWVTTPRLLAVVAILPVCITWTEWRDAFSGYDPSRQLSYISPMVVIQSLCLFELFTRIRIRGARLRKLLPALSGSAFGVYLIDSSSWLYGAWLNDRFAWIRDMTVRYGVPLLLGITVLMFFAFLLLEAIRRKAFSKAGDLLRRGANRFAD